MNKKGQALIEFIIVLPVLIVLMLIIIDFGIIFMKQNSLENSLEEVTEMWKDNQSVDEVNRYLNKLDNKIEFRTKNIENDTELILESDYFVSTPGLNLILGNPYKIKVSRVIYNG